jgi:hypothetical protein
MTLETDIGTGRHLEAGQDERQFRWVYAVIFSLTLIPVLFSRLAPWRRRAQVGLTHRSVMDETRARTSRVVPFFFMG